jgi:uncharacterized repeat protein (TIGR01451 family)
MKHMRFLLCLTALWALFSPTLSAQEFFFSAEKPETCSSANGILTIVPVRGVPPFTYQWSTGATDVSLKNAPKGSYTATMTDAFGASVTHSYFLNSAEFDIYLADSRPTSGCTPTSGALTVQALNGAGPFSYAWSNGQSGPTISGLGNGTYTVTATDASGCTALGAYEVKSVDWSYAPTAFAEELTAPDCINTNGGSLIAGMQYSWFGPNTYQWSNGATTETVSNLAKGNYTVTVTDGLGCSRVTFISLNNGITMNSNVICSGSSSGTLSTQLLNATAPVNYTWSNGQTGSTLSNLPQGAYQVVATDANGCSSDAWGYVNIPDVFVQSYDLKCYAGNNGAAYLYVINDTPTSILWDNGDTDVYNNTLSAGAHTVTVTTTLGCTIVESFNIAPPIAPPYQITASATPGNCSTGAGGAISISVSGGLPSYSFYASGDNGFQGNSIASLQNVASGTYWFSVYNNATGCFGSGSATVTDASGFNPELAVQDISCDNPLGALAVGNVTNTDAQYSWSNGETNPALFNLTQGCHTVTVTAAGGNCAKILRACLPNGEDSTQTVDDCFARIGGVLVNDNGVPGCTGSTGIPFQLLRTEPSGALNFTDGTGQYSIGLPSGTFTITPASYDPADIACPAGASHTIAVVQGSNQSGLDFHFYNPNAVDYRVTQRPLRTAQPGFPYSLRLQVCNDGSSAPASTLDFEYGNFLGNLGSGNFSQNSGLFSLNGSSSGAPNNNASFSFPSIAAGKCELLQVDFLTPTTAIAGTQFVTEAKVGPGSGDPTPDNNTSSLLTTVVGSYDPNAVYAFPARNGNPKDGGDIFRNVDQKITYQIVFQNTGSAAANLVVVKDTLNEFLNINTIRNISSTHDMRVRLEDDNKVLVFQFPNINLADSTTDFASSIGSIQFDIDLKPGVVLGDLVEKRAGIYFDFNPPIITNTNTLKVVDATNATLTPKRQGEAVLVFPNPANEYFSFQLAEPALVRLFNSTGDLVLSEKTDKGLQRVRTENLPMGIYTAQFLVGDVAMHARVVVQR